MSEIKHTAPEPTTLATVVESDRQAAQVESDLATRRIIEKARSIPCNLSTINIITFSESLTSDQLEKVQKWAYEIAKEVNTTEVLDVYLNKETRVHEISFKSKMQQNYFMALLFKFISEFELDNIVATLGVKSVVQVSTAALREWCDRDRLIRLRIGELVAKHKEDGLSEEESREILVKEILSVSHYDADKAKIEFEKMLREAKAKLDEGGSSGDGVENN